MLSEMMSNRSYIYLKTNDITKICLGSEGTSSEKPRKEVSTGIRAAKVAIGGLREGRLLVHG